LSSWALLRLLPLQAKPVWSRIISYGLLAGGMALTHPYGIFTLAAQLLFLGAVSVQAFVSSPQSARPQIRIPVAAAAIPIAAYCLWLPIVLEQMARVRYDYWIPPFRWDTISTS